MWAALNLTLENWGVFIKHGAFLKDQFLSQSIINNGVIHHLFVHLSVQVNTLQNILIMWLSIVFISWSNIFIFHYDVWASCYVVIVKLTDAFGFSSWAKHSNLIYFLWNSFFQINLIILLLIKPIRSLVIGLRESLHILFILIMTQVQMIRLFRINVTGSIPMIMGSQSQAIV